MPIASPFAATAVAKLPVRSCLIDGEAIVCDANGLAVFDLLRRRWRGEDVILCAFDLLEALPSHRPCRVPSPSGTAVAEGACAVTVSRPSPETTVGGALHRSAILNGWSGSWSP